MSYKSHINIKTTVCRIVMISCLTLNGIISCQDMEHPAADYGDGLVSIHEGSRITAGQATLKSLRDAIRVYYLSNNAYPASIEEIQDLVDSPIDTGLYEYDPSNGKITMAD